MLDKIPESVRRVLEGERAGIDVLFPCFAASRWGVTRGRSVFTAAPLRTSEPIPVQATADGEGISPPLSWVGVPEEAQQVIVIVEDADSQTPYPWVHAIAVLSGLDGALGSGALPSGEHEGAGVCTGLNSACCEHRWLPPDPPAGHGPHRYVFQMFALAGGAELSERVGRRGVEEADLLTRAMAAGWLIRDLRAAQAAESGEPPGGDGRRGSRARAFWRGRGCRHPRELSRRQPVFGAVVERGVNASKGRDRSASRIPDAECKPCD